MRPMKGFRLAYRRTVEFRDLDALGHVNNAVYLSYVESARLAYMQEVLGPLELEELGIVAEARIAFRAASVLGETLEVGTRVAEIGGKSLRFEFEIQGENGRLVADGSTVHVAYDHGNGRSIPVPDEWRRRIDAYETETRSLAAT
jgi:acyl-CoA thioester hydrolase